MITYCSALGDVIVCTMTKRHFLTGENWTLHKLALIDRAEIKYSVQVLRFLLVQVWPENFVTSFYTQQRRY